MWAHLAGDHPRVQVRPVLAETTESLGARRTRGTLCLLYFVANINEVCSLPLPTPDCPVDGVEGIRPASRDYFGYIVTKVCPLRLPSFPCSPSSVLVE